MKRIITGLLAAAVLWSAPAYAWLAQGTSAVTPTTQVLLGQISTGVPSGSDTYYPISYGSGVTTLTDDALTVFPVAGTLKQLYVRVNGTAPTGITTWTITITKNGVDTALQCTISSGSSGVCTITTNVSFAAGDYGLVKFHPTSSPTSARMHWYAIFQPTVANDTMLSGWGNPFSATANSVQVPFTTVGVGVLSTRRLPAFPDAGTVDTLYVRAPTTPPGAAASGKSFSYTVGKNGSVAGSPPTCTMTEVQTGCNSSSNSQTIVAPSGVTPGSDIQIEADPSATVPTAAIAGVAVRYVPATAGHFPLMFSGGTTMSGTGTFFISLSGGSNGLIGTEGNVQNVVPAMTMKTMAVSLGTAPGAGKSREFAMSVGGTPNATFTCTIADTDKACVATGSVALSAGDLVTTREVPTGTPASTLYNVSYLATQ